MAYGPCPGSAAGTCRHPAASTTAIEKLPDEICYVGLDLVLRSPEKELGNSARTDTVVIAKVLPQESHGLDLSVTAPPPQVVAPQLSRCVLRPFRVSVKVEIRLDQMDAGDAVVCRCRAVKHPLVIRDDEPRIGAMSVVVERNFFNEIR